MLDELFLNFFLKLYPVSISTNNDKNIINENRKININDIVRLLRTIIKRLFA